MFLNNHVKDWANVSENRLCLNDELQLHVMNCCLSQAARQGKATGPAPQESKAWIQQEGPSNTTDGKAHAAQQPGS